MKTGMIFLAADILATLRHWVTNGSGSFQSLIFWSVLVLIAFGVFAWAVMFRQQDRPHRHHHRHHDSPDQKKSGRGGKRRRKHRPMNPTLAETGGLPEPRDGKNQPPV